jgi:hypothetical protein
MHLFVLIVASPLEAPPVQHSSSKWNEKPTGGKTMKPHSATGDCRGTVTPRKSRAVCDGHNVVTYVLARPASVTPAQRHRARDPHSSSSPWSHRSRESGSRTTTDPSASSSLHMLGRHPCGVGTDAADCEAGYSVTCAAPAHQCDTISSVTAGRPCESALWDIHQVPRKRDGRSGATERRHTTRPNPTPRLACRSRSASPRLHCS